MADDSKTAAQGDQDNVPDTEATSEAKLFEPAAVSSDELDPELLALPRPKMSIGPVLVVCVVIFSGYLLYQLYSDLRFSRQPEEPHTLTSMSEAIDPANIDRYVRIRAVPDRSFAIRVARSKADRGSRFTPVQGSNNRLWLMLDGSVWTAGIRYDEVYRGRLRLVADMPFGDEVREHTRARGPGPRFVQPDQIKSALAANGKSSGQTAELEESSGDTLAVTAETSVHILEVAADRARIQAFATDSLKTASDWTQALSQAGLVAPDTRPEAGPKESWIYVATIAGGVEPARVALRQAKLFSARVHPISTSHDTTWRDLADQGEFLAFGNVRIPWRNVSWVAVDVAREVPPDAFVLLTRESPETYWYILPLFVLVGLFAVLFLWAFARIVRAAIKSRETPQTAPSA